MGSNEVTKEDLRDVRDVLTELIDKGFRGVHERQDVTNGRVQKAEVIQGEHRVRLTNVEREVFHRRQSDRGGPDDAQALTRRELKIVIATITATVTVATFIWKVLPVLLKALG